MDYLSATWCDLAWSDWYIFDEIINARGLLPKKSGIYRIRPTEFERLVYIGQSSNLHRRIRHDLIPNVCADQMPFNDPHTAAQSLWVWQATEGLTYEVSVTEIDDTAVGLQKLECYLLWRYRVEGSESTMCNHGRFHARYTRSSDRKEGRRGTLIADGPDNPASGSSWPGLQLSGHPSETEWMGLGWTSFSDIRQMVNQLSDDRVGVYRLKDSETQRLLYIGQTTNLKRRLRRHTRDDWKCSSVECSVCELSETMLSHQLKEIENDLIGACYSTSHSLPLHQFARHSKAH